VRERRYGGKNLGLEEISALFAAAFWEQRI
jgi:hypothetical protein